MFDVGLNFNPHLPSSVIYTSGCGYIINDYFDLNIDLITSLVKWWLTS